MTGKKRMPQLKMDEVLLLVDAYFQLKDIHDTSLRTEMIQELSCSMRALPFFPSLRDEPAFRSVSGMNMCLKNVSFIDPDTNSGFGHGSELQMKVFSYYAKNRKQLHTIASTIKAISVLEFPIMQVYENSIIGQLIPSYHVHLEHTDRTVQNACKIAFQHKRMRCTICGIDLESRYGDYGNSLLEPHIALPATQLNGKQEITTSDILFVCPTCHKLAHLSPELFEEQLLRETIKG